jgi:hypothetical protein
MRSRRSLNSQLSLCFDGPKPPPVPGLGPLHSELTRAFAFFNARYWSGRLPVPVFAFFRQPPKGRRLGHFRARTWHAPDGSLRDEIVIYADLALSRGMQAILETLLHEMVHVWQEHFGHRGAVHNAQWHAEAARVGLLTDGPQGFTSSGPGFVAAVAELRPRVDGIPFRARETAHRKGKLVRWSCACGFGVRVAVWHFDATCNVCRQPFRLSKRTPAAGRPSSTSAIDFDGEESP